MEKSSLLKTILISGLIAGTMDILSAIFLLAKGQAGVILKYVASGAFGKAALAGGNDMVAWGLLFHYSIAMSFTAAYFLLYPKLPILKHNVWINAVFYGIFAWSVMNLVVVPLSQIPPRPFNWESALKNAAILVVCIGFPIAWFADKFYAKT